MYWYGGHMTGWGYALAGLGTVAFWALVIVGVVLLGRHLGRAGQAPPPPSAEHILAERFARGDIDAAEYHERLGVLRKYLGS